VIKNYTTKVSEGKTVSEIMQMLAEKGASRVQVEYDEQNRPKALAFMIMVNDVTIPFQLPCNFEGVLNAMVKQYKDSWTRSDKRKDAKFLEQSRRCAWRIIKDWVAAQMALIEAEQATLAEVFTPYMKIKGMTAYQFFVVHILPADRQLTSGGIRDVSGTG
jgi:hypothetical protein